MAESVRNAISITRKMGRHGRNAKEERTYGMDYPFHKKGACMQRLLETRSASSGNEIKILLEMERKRPSCTEKSPLGGAAVRPLKVRTFPGSAWPLISVRFSKVQISAT